MIKKIILLVACLFLLVSTSFAGTVALLGGEFIIVDSGAEWRYSDMEQPGWTEISFDDSQWNTGITPFDDHSVTGWCDFGGNGTNWPLYTSLYLRKNIDVKQQGALTLRIAIDNDFLLYFDGNEVAAIYSESCPYKWEYEYNIPSVNAGTHTVAVKITDRGDDNGFDLMASQASAAGSFKLPDTGQTKCYRGVDPYDEIPCEGTGQDGAYSINPMSYTDNPDGTVTDNNTGLIWQKEDDGQTYNWYRASGTYDANFNPELTDVCGSLDLGNTTDWRLPSKKELLSIVDYAIPYPGPTISTVHFPNAKASTYWSSTKGANPLNYAWYFYFQNGLVSGCDLSGCALYVRCVSGGQTPGHTLTNNGDGTVTDSRTGLMWQQGEPGTKMWSDALSYCENLELPTGSGQIDWRLPNIKELESLVDDTRYNPAIDTSVFPNAPAGYVHYLSSTTNTNNPSSAWYVFFYDGGVGFDGDKNSNFAYVRCVRGGNVTPNLEVTYSSHNFGEIAVDMCSAIPQVFTISNTGNAYLLVSSIELSDNANFVLGGTGNVLTDCLIDNPLGTFIEPGGSCTFAVNFCPTSPGTHDAYLTISSNDPDGSRNVQLMGVGVGLFKLSFPLKDNNPYTVNTASVLDHSGPFYNEVSHTNNVIKAYTGEEARCEYGAAEYLGSRRYRYYMEGTRELARICSNSNRSGTWGYMKEDHSGITIPGQGNYLWYDGHPGYDYPVVTDIVAPEDGILCISTSVTSKPKKVNSPWRDVNKCPYGNDPINGRNGKATSWDGWHTFYIVHNIDNYTTWYLHSAYLDNAVQNSILNDGYASVTKDQTIARVGNYGTGGPHLHFEVRKGDRNIVDPYGWGSDPVLWNSP